MSALTYVLLVLNILLEGSGKSVVMWVSAFKTLQYNKVNKSIDPRLSNRFKSLRLSLEVVL